MDNKRSSLCSARFMIFFYIEKRLHTAHIYMNKRVHTEEKKFICYRKKQMNTINQASSFAVVEQPTLCFSFEVQIHSIALAVVSSRKYVGPFSIISS